MIDPVLRHVEAQRLVRSHWDVSEARRKRKSHPLSAARDQDSVPAL
jgi:hypothetical protein